MNGMSLLLLSTFLAVLSCNHVGTAPYALKESTQLKVATDTLTYQNFNGNNWVIIECMVNGKNARLVIDNGTKDGLYLDKQFALVNQLISKDSAVADIINLKDVEVLIGAARERVSQCTVFDLRPTTGNTVDGLLGISFLENYFLEVNYKKNYLIFHRPDSFKVPEKWSALKLNRAARGTGRFASMEVYLPNGKKIVEAAQLDLGLGSSPLFFPGSIVRKYHLNSLIKGVELKDLGKFVTGEEVQGYVYVLDSLRLNNVLFKSVSSEFTVSKQGMSSDVRILFGNGLLKTLGTVLFDFKSDVLYFPNHEKLK
jgi:hypothetical protein